MTAKELNEKHTAIIDALVCKEITIALDKLSGLIGQSHNADLKSQMEKHTETYHNMLKYSFNYGPDPERENVHRRLIRSLLTLADETRESLIITYNLSSFAIRKAQVKRNLSQWSSQDSEELVDELAADSDLRSLIKSAFGESSDKSPIKTRETFSKIFYVIWLTDQFKETHTTLLKGIIHSDTIPWYDKSTLVSALTLSLQRYFDFDKFNALCDFYDAAEDQVWQRALVGIFIAAITHNNRLEYYPEVINRLKSYAGNASFEKDIEFIIIQYLKSKETEKISKKIQEEILPHMMKIKTKLETKLDLDNILSVEDFEDKNPEWKNMFKDTPNLYEKFEEFSMMQMEGSDVFLSAFAMLKRFDFFNPISNWFVPFYSENDALEGVITDEKGDFDVDKFIKGLEKSHFLCNSDKYSFCLNIKYMPSMQKSMMMEMFNMELKAMNEMEESDSKVNHNMKRQTVFTQYFQDLYRFFRLFPRKEEFEDFFSVQVDFEQLHLLSLLNKKQKILRNIGEFYFEKEYYHAALKIFKSFDEKDQSFELFEKIAYAYQQLKDFPRALGYYKKAALYDQNRAWVMKKIAFCHRKLKQFNEALENYREVEKMRPDDLHIQANLGHTYMELGDYDEALNYYFKVEYLDPKNYKIHRPIAWCSFIQGKFDTARKYFKKIIEADANHYDYLNLGHVEWCDGNTKKAIENYRKSLSKTDYDYEWFYKEFKEDRKNLLKHGIDEMDMSLMKDYLRMKEE